jgi:hypothetical protein
MNERWRRFDDDGDLIVVAVGWGRVFRRQLVRQLGPHIHDQLAHRRADVFRALEFEELLVNLLLLSQRNEQQEQPQPCPMPIMPRPPDISPTIIA